MNHQISLVTNIYVVNMQGEKQHPGMEMMYEYHSNQAEDPSNVLMHALGQWRLTRLFHDLVFLPQVVVSLSS